MNFFLIENTINTWNTINKMLQQKTLSNIVRMERKTRKEENQLVMLAQSGDQKSKDELINNNVKLVINLANRFKNCNLELEDLVGEGIVGLQEAIRRFSGAKQTKFTTYATYWAYNKIAEYVRRNSKSVRFPTYLLNLSRDVAKYQREYIAKYHKPPTKAHLQRKFKFSSSKLERIFSVFSEVESLDAQNGENEDDNLLNLLPDERHEENPYEHTFQVLSKEEREILELNSGAFERKLSYKTLAKKYNKSYREIKNIIERSKSKLSKELKREKVYV